MPSDQIKIDPCKFAFFGSSKLSVTVLDELAKLGRSPSFIVTSPDKPQGRKLLLQPNIVKKWAAEHSITCYNPARLDDAFTSVIREAAEKSQTELFVVASFGRILPKTIFDLPKFRTLNIHPSLLPKYRGPSPLPSTMINDDKKTGVTIMKIDAEMDHGPIIAQKPVTVSEWPIYEEFEEMMAREGARLLNETIPKWISGEMIEQPQDHATATYTTKILKNDAELPCPEQDAPEDKQYEMFRKIQAYHEWPQAFFIALRNNVKVRVKITAASFTNGRLQIEKVIPEGRREMTFNDFLHGFRCQKHGEH
jgi:methionyl-tRNA formyltransferase